MDRYVQWLDDNDVFLNFYVLKIIDGFDGLEITLKSEKDNDNEMVIFFENYFAYRMTEESAFLKTLGEGQLFNFSRATSSSYLDWFNLESSGAYIYFSLNHYLIYGTNKVFEIIAAADPKVKLKSLKI